MTVRVCRFHPLFCPRFRLVIPKSAREHPSLFGPNHQPPKGGGSLVRERERKNNIFISPVLLTSFVCFSSSTTTTTTPSSDDDSFLMPVAVGGRVEVFSLCFHHRVAGRRRRFSSSEIHSHQSVLQTRIHSVRYITTYSQRDFSERSLC